MITTKKNLFVVGDSNIYGDEQLNDNSLGINAGVLGPPGELFNFPSTKTYPYFIPDREIKNISLPGLSIDSQGHLYMQMVLPHLKKGDELLMHLPPVTRDSIYYDWDPRIIDNPNRYKIFKKWALRYAGIEPTHDMFIIFCNLFAQRNVNPRHIEKFKNPKEITLFLDKYYWSPANMVNKFKNIIHLVETTSPAKNFYVFQSLNLTEENIRESKVNSLNDMLKPLGVNFNLIDDNWTANMKDIGKELGIQRYPLGHFHPDVHEEYCKRYVKKHFLV